MRHFSLLGLLGLFLMLSLATRVADAQDDAAPAADGAEEGGDDAAAGGEDAEKEEECEEAWEYVEFLKETLKEKIESILQDTLFQPRPLLEETVTKTMEQVLEMRDEILTRTKSIRTGDGEVNLCPGQNINQEEFLTQVRMQIMTVLLSLIEKDAAQPEKLQDVGKELLSIRTKVNNEITRMIMLRESTVTERRVVDDECDCGILGTVVEGLDGVISKGDEEEKEEGGDEEEGGDDAETPAADDDAEATDAAGGMDPVTDLTMILMSVDAEIATLYNEILAEMDDEKRTELSDKLLQHKGISIDLHEVMSKMSELDPENDKEAIERLIRRDIRSIRNDVKRALDKCQQNCPGECKSCGAQKIKDVSDKLKDYALQLEDLDEEEAKETIRTDLMTFLTQTNTDMTDLLKMKAQDGELDDCGNEELEVINKIKGPLWMMVNITIFGDGATMGEMIGALETALTEMRSQYCGPDDSPVVNDRNTDIPDCDLNEINTARDWITDIDTVISEDIFKSEDEDARRKAMLGLIELKSAMDDRVRELFQNNLQCKEEVEQIKNIYGQKVTECLAEMMNPRFRFELLGRAERVQCVKTLRIQMEDRRGVLLMREIENRINQIGAESVGDEEGGEQ